MHYVRCVAATEERVAAERLWFDPSGRGLTRWADCVPGRRDLPRTLPDLDVLGITPLGPTDPVPGSEGLCFRRTARPGQGRLTGRPTRGLCVVLISPKHPTEDAARSLRDWADFVHLSHIAAAAVPGYTMVTPYEIDSPGPAVTRYLHLYEMDSDDPEACFSAMTPLVRARLGDGAAFEQWAWHPELRIDYVSTYRRLDP